MEYLDRKKSCYFIVIILKFLTFSGHVSNVFATCFLPHKSDREVISGSNDSDIRYFNLDTKYCTVYKHHLKKVLSMCVNQTAPDTFLSCSADATVRLYDIRCNYTGSKTEKFESSTNHEHNIIPQALGGGRRTDRTKPKETLLLDYKDGTVLYSIDISPNGYNFIVGGGDGNVRMFDLRYVKNNCDDYVNIFRNIEVKPSYNCEATGCQFSKDGKEIVASLLSQYIYVFDVNTNYQKEFLIDYKENNLNSNKIKKVRKIPFEKAKDLTQEEVKLTSMITHIVNNKYYGQKEGISQDPIEDSEIEDTEDESDDEIEISDEESEIKTYKYQYKGHESRQTIKGVGFMGYNSEYVISGSDDNNIFIWDKKSSKLVRVLEGHDGIVNTCTLHPTLPLIASSGIDSYVKIWSPNGSLPDDDELYTRKKRIQNIIEENTEKPIGRNMNSQNMYNLLNILRSMYQQDQ